MRLELMGDAFSLNRSVLDQEQCVNKNWKDGWMDGYLQIPGRNIAWLGRGRMEMFIDLPAEINPEKTY